MKGSVAVFGCGSIGRRHAGNLKALGARVIAYDPDPERLAWVVRETGAAPARSPEEALAGGVRAAWVCVPPHLHESAAVAALRRRVPCFVEKPLAHDLASARRLSAVARGARAEAVVGYQLRHHPALLRLKRDVESGRWGRLLFLRAQLGQYLPDWRPWQDYRKSYTARRRMGGGILLDGSHEIDLSLWIGGPARRVSCVAKKLSALEIDVEDYAALTLELKSGAVAEVHLDMVSRAYRRTFEVSFEKATVIWDLPARELRTYTAASKKWAVERFPVDLNSLYVAEAREFLRSGHGVSIEEGLAALAVAHAAARAAATGRTQEVPSA